MELDEQPSSAQASYADNFAYGDVPRDATAIGVSQRELKIAH